MKKLSIPVSSTLELSVLYDNCLFDKGAVNLQMEKLSVASSEMIAYARMCGGISSLLAKNPFWTAECQVYIPEEGVFLVSAERNPILKNLRAAYLARTRGDDFPVEDSCAEEIIRDASTNISEAKESGVLRLPDEFRKSDAYTWHIRNLGKDDIGCFLFGKYALDYQKFLRRNEIEKLAYGYLPFECSRTKSPVAIPVVLDSINFSFAIQTSWQLSYESVYVCSITEQGVEKKSILTRVLSQLKVCFKPH